uniref:Fucolectin tachylectin-4 pentraxin-1 domain-containing protein n=1 Tax=Branchiostoma floridae TaxID=7739 RepID=C3ZLD3_BRAFL|eukprot:XP_002590804.1 hypothetical protein BRAFLDRAFT_78220 [Branchiostoma floridae]
MDFLVLCLLVIVMLLLASVFRMLSDTQVPYFTAIIIVLCLIPLGNIYNDAKILDLQHKRVDLHHKMVEYRRQKVEFMQTILTATDTYTQVTQENGWLWGVKRVITHTVQKLKYTPEQVHAYIGRMMDVIEYSWGLVLCFLVAAVVVTVIRWLDRRKAYIFAMMLTFVLYTYVYFNLQPIPDMPDWRWMAQPIQDHDSPNTPFSWTVFITVAAVLVLLIRAVDIRQAFTIAMVAGFALFVFAYSLLHLGGTFALSKSTVPPTCLRLVLGNLPRNYANLDVARAEYVSPLEHSKAKGRSLAGIIEAPCTVKWSNSYQIKPAEEGGRCLYFVAASSGDIFVVFSAIPRDKTTWYHLQISYQGVTLYKGMKLVKYEGAKSARSLGDSKLFQPYFICLEEDHENQRTYIKYGIGSDTSEKGLVYMVYNDVGPPLGIRFYSFGSGEVDVEIMDARIIEGGAQGEMECTGGTVLKDGQCVEDCHPECDGCIPISPGSKLDTECRSCKHFSFDKGGGVIQCVAECPAGTEPAPDGKTCVCKGFVFNNDDGSSRCVSACGTGFGPASDGKTCVVASKWRNDGKCGRNNPAPGANPGWCSPKSDKPCCSEYGWCGNTHCTCSECVDYRKVANIARLKPAYQSSTGGSASAGRAVDGDTNSIWTGNSCTHTDEEDNPTWYVDLGESSKVASVAIYNRMDCCGFRLNPFNIHIGNSPTVADNPKCGRDHRATEQPFTVSCPGMRGRYVGIRLPGASRALTLCEVQVYEAPPAQQTGHRDSLPHLRIMSHWWRCSSWKKKLGTVDQQEQKFCRSQTFPNMTIAVDYTCSHNGPFLSNTVSPAPCSISNTSGKTSETRAEMAANDGPRPAGRNGDSAFMQPDDVTKAAK